MASLRFLLRQRSYFAMGWTTLVLSVGVNLVVLTIVDALWLRQRPVADPDRVVMVMGDSSATGTSESMFFAAAGLQTFVRDIAAFDLVAGQVMTAGSNTGLLPRPVLDVVGRAVETVAVTPEYFGVLGLPVRGRDFVKNDDLFGAAPVAIVSDRLWKSALGGRDDVIGRVAPASPFPLQIIGVAPAGFQGARLGEDVDLWVPRALTPRLSAVGANPDGSGATPMLAIAHLAAGFTPSAAERLVRAAGRGPMMSNLIVVPLSMVYGSPDHRTLIINEGPVLRVIATTAVLVLVGGCATLMALVLVHYERRRQEFAVRLALGASRGRLVRRLTAELLWLATVGSLGALMVAAWGIGALPALDLPSGVNLARLNLSIDWRVAIAGLGASFLTMIAGATLPLLRFTDGGVARHLITPVATANASSLRLRKCMLGLHVAATVVVLVAAGLFVRTIERGFGAGAGFDVDRTAFGSVDVVTPRAMGRLQAAARARGGVLDPREGRRAETDRLRAALNELREQTTARVLEGLAGWPGVEVLAVGRIPLGPDEASDVAQSKVVETDGVRRSMHVGRVNADPTYVEALGLRVIEGRGLADTDRLEEGGPALVTRSLAAELWPGQSAVGRHLRFGYGEPTSDRTVVGVLQDFAYGSMRFDPPAVIVQPRWTVAQNTLQIAVRSTAPDRLVESLRRRLAALVPEAPRLSVVTGRDLVAADLGRERLGAWFFSGFGVVALVLSIGGVFGLIAYHAESRRREFGVRIALGATPASVVRLAVVAGVLPAAVGAAFGLVGAAWLAKAAESFLIGIGRLDPLSYAGAFVLMLTIATGAGLAAAWRVRRVSPMDALRAE